jgi:DNA repair photolyase
MTELISLKSLRGNKSKLYDLRGFDPRIIDLSYLKELNAEVKPSEETLQELERGSSVFVKRYNEKSLVSELSYVSQDIPLEKPLEFHRYTSKCPTDVLQVDPMTGCGVNCLYCLVTGGDHSKPKIVYRNYRAYLRRNLEEENGKAYVYYFAPQTEPLQEATLQTGIAHDIFREYITYFKKNPKSESKLFMISKAGKEELLYKNNGNSILDLMGELSSHLEYNPSISVMPPELYDVLEPRAASVENRLKAANLCQERGILVKSAIVQPIIPPYLTEETMDDLFKKLKSANISSFKPEFLTLSTENLAWIGQLIGYYDKGMEKELYDLYTAPENRSNIKHRRRLAPTRKFSHKAMINLKKGADKYGMKTNICNWVRSELNISSEEVPRSKRIVRGGEQESCKI